MNAVVRRILEAVRDGKVTPGTRALARGVLEGEDRRDVLAAAKSCTTAHVAKQAIASVEHHEKVRREEERLEEETAEETWTFCLHRTRIYHRGRQACEACHRERGLEPHHLKMGAGGREDVPEFVMAICRECHTLDPMSAHRSPRHFAHTIVIAWAKNHDYPLPNRKEYRDA